MTSVVVIGVTFAARSAAAQGDPARSTDGNGGATTPKNKSTGIDVRFDDSAAALPQEEIRAAIARELEHRPHGEASVAGELDVAVDGNQLVVRFRGAQGYTERLLPLPEDRTQIPLMLSLLAGNLARDQSPGVRPAPLAPVPEAWERAPREPSFKQHYLGLHLGQDIAFAGGFEVCNRTIGTFSCYYPGTDQPFFHSPNPNSDTVTNHPVLATTRVLFSYDFAPWRRFSIGARIGFAFRGGPPAGMSPDPPVTDPPSHSAGAGGTPFFPGHFELRASYWFAPLTNERWRGFFGVGAGMAQVDARVDHHVVDCEETAPPSTDIDAFSACQNGTVASNPAPQTAVERLAEDRPGLSGVPHRRHRNPHG